MWIEQRSSSISHCPFNPTLPIQYEKSLFFHWHVYIGILLNELSFFPFLPFSKSNIFRSKKFDFDFCLGGWWPFLATGNAWTTREQSKDAMQATSRQQDSNFSIYCVSECATTSKYSKSKASIYQYQAQHHPPINTQYDSPILLAKIVGV